jgi:hypothetical protein
MRVNRMYKEEFIRLPIHPGSPWSPSLLGLVRVLSYLPLKTQSHRKNVIHGFV